MPDFKETLTAQDTALTIDRIPKDTSVLSVQLSGTWAGTLTFQARVNGSDWESVLAVNVSAIASTATANGIYALLIAGADAVRVYWTARTSGSAVVSATLARGGAGFSLISAILAASEAHIGEVGSGDKLIKVAQTVTAALYASGNCIGGKITLANAIRSAGRSTLLQNVGITDAGNQKAAIDFLIFDADPASSTITDKAAFVLHADDVDKVIGRVSIAAADYVTVGSVAFASAPNLARVLEAASGTTLYAAAVTTSAPTYTATTNVKLRFGFLRN